MYPAKFSACQDMLVGEIHSALLCRK